MKERKVRNFRFTGLGNCHQPHLLVESPSLLPPMSSTPSPDVRHFRRAILKLSGEALREIGSRDNISPEIVDRIASEIAAAMKSGLQLGVVVGGGNFWRGASASARGMDRATADYVGMLATVMNALALQSALEDEGVPCVVMSAIEMKNVAETFIRRRAEKYLDEGKVVIFAAGTGSPFFSTDTTAALRASEMGAQVIFKATMVDGVYDSDPKKNPDAKRYETVSFQECISSQLKVMDTTAFSLCMDNHIPIIVFDLEQPGNITTALTGGAIGTVVQ
jgi:uridylate kinase